MIGSKVPDLRGLFLRGKGAQKFNSGGYGPIVHQSEPLWNKDSITVSKVQGDAIRNIWGIFDTGENEQHQFVDDSYTSGMITSFWSRKRPTSDPSVNWLTRPRGLTFDSSLIVPVDTKNRPIHLGVRYLIRAKN